MDYSGAVLRKQEELYKNGSNPAPAPNYMKRAVRLAMEEEVMLVDRALRIDVIRLECGALTEEELNACAAIESGS